MLGCLDRVRGEPVAPNPLRIRELGGHRADAGDAELHRLLDDEVGAGLLHRREEEPQVGRVPLRRGLLDAGEQTAALSSLGDLGPPLAVAPVEEEHRRALAEAHHPEEVMRLLPRQGNGLPGPKRMVYMEPHHGHEADHMRSTTGEPRGAAPGGQVADAVRGNWVDHWAPEAARPYLRLSRADRPIGTWLLLLPCWWGLLLAAASTGRFGLYEAWVGIGCGIGAWLMRGAGCTWNDVTDRHYDGRVARTRSRPIPSGQVSVRQALAWAVAQSLLAFGILLTFHPTAIALGIGSLLLVAIYPFAKRFTWWPQVFLGLAFNWGALLAWAAVAGRISAAPVALYLAGIAWTLFYDTIYAHQDKEDDALIGVKSTARLFGADTARWLRWFLVASVGLMVLAVLAALLPSADALGLSLALLGPLAFAGHLVWQLARLDTDDPENCLRLFRTNRDAGLLVALFLAAVNLV